MKTVSAEIVSSKPISLSRAARFLSSFVEYDNCASRVTSTYLRRTSDAFTELCEFHKKLNSFGSNRERNRGYARSGISSVQNENSAVSNRSSEGEKVAKNRKEEADKGRLVRFPEIGVNGSKSLPRNVQEEVLENGLKGNFANGVEDNSEAAIEKKHKKKHKRKDWDDESAENGSKARERDVDSIVKTSVSKGDDSSEKSSEKKITKKKKRKGEEGDDSLLSNAVISAGEKEVSEGRRRYGNSVSLRLGEGVAVDLPEESESLERKGKRKKKKKGDEGHDSLLPNGVSTIEREIS